MTNNKQKAINKVLDDFAEKIKEELYCTCTPPCKYPYEFIAKSIDKILKELKENGKTNKRN